MKLPRIKIRSNKAIMAAVVAVLAIGAAMPAQAGDKGPKMTKQERVCLRNGNKLYEKKRYAEANPASEKAQFNLATALMRQGSVTAQQDDDKNPMKQAEGILTNLAKGAQDKQLRGKASYDLGNIAYVVPGICAFILMLIGVVNWREFRDGIFAPVILMMAGVIPIANALADSGLTALIGEAVAGAAGGMSPFVIVFVFSLLTSTCATFTGSNIGSAFIFCPIAVATCMQLGVSPLAACSAVMLSAWQGGYMPVDGLPAMIYGMGKYTLPEFWKFTVPMYFIRIAAMSLGAVLVFPM